MNNEHERTLKMKREYVGLFNAGYGPREIAKKFAISESTVYGSLQEIADATDGIDNRSQLLVQPHNAPEGYEREYAPVKPVDVHLLLSSTREVIAQSQRVSAKLDQYLIEQESDTATEHGEEME